MEDDGGLLILLFSPHLLWRFFLLFFLSALFFFTIHSSSPIPLNYKTNKSTQPNTTTHNHPQPTQPNTTIKEARGWVFSCLDCRLSVVWIDSCIGSTNKPTQPNQAGKRKFGVFGFRDNWEWYAIYFFFTNFPTTIFQISTIISSLRIRRYTPYTPKKSTAEIARVKNDPNPSILTHSDATVPKMSAKAILP